MATDATAYFSQINDDGGVSVRSHLAELVHQLLISKDPNALEKLESISLEVKKGHFSADAPGVKDIPEVSALPSEGWHKASKALCTTEGASGNLVEDMGLFEWAGVGLAKEDVYRVHLAMGQVRASAGLASIRFFGKIMGTQSDYYVLEGTYAKAPAADPDAPADQEAPGTGLNAKVFFVSQSPSDPFVQLPDVSPAQVVASRSIRKYFTGNLDAPVACYPAFPGSEAAYLRAQLARLAADTVLAPSGKYTLDEDVEDGPKPVILADDFVM